VISALKATSQSQLAAVGRAIGALGITPNSLTIFGLLANVVAAGVVTAGFPQAGGVGLLLASAVDMLDGAVARATGTTTRFGAFLDSVADRYSEAVMFAALIIVFAQKGETGLGVGAVMALIGSLLVSYARARAEGLGLDCEVGFFQRPERVVALAVGLLLPDLLLTPVVWILAVVTNVTVLQRVLHVRRLLADE
jgi:CDP-diacylglycerol--glycerol-3-phosphate 3-phosphatidyltransferase